MVYLTDVKKHSGAFQYINGSHKISFIIKQLILKYWNKLQNKTRFNEKLVDNILDESKLNITTTIAKKGPLVFFDPRGLHRGSPIKSGNRIALTNYIVAKEFDNKKSEIYKSKIKI